MPKRHTASGAEALFAAALFYAGTNALVRYMSPMWGNQAQVFARFAVAWLLVIGLNHVRKEKPQRALGKKWSTVIALSVAWSLATLLYTLAVERTTIANVLFLSYATTMTVQFFLGTVVLKEQVTRSKVAAILLALIGLALYSHSLTSGNLGELFSVLAGATGAFAGLANKKLAGVDRAAVLQVQYGFGAILLLAITLLSGGHFLRTISLGGILITVGFSITILIASYLILYGYQHIDVNIGTVISSSELVFGVIVGFVLFHEIPNPLEALSGTFIALGSIIAAIGQKTEQLSP